MTNENILEQLNEIFIDVLDNEDISLNENTVADDVEDWDSLNHIQLVVSIEKKFKIKFNSQEIQSWKNIGSIIDSIVSKIK